MNWFTDPHNTIFAAAFTVMLCFAVLEAISLFLGLGLSEWLGKLLPIHADAHVDAPAADAPAADAATVGDHSGDVSHSTDHAPHQTGIMGHLLSWLEVGRIPVLVSLNIFLAAFSVLGFILQGALETFHLPMLPGWIAAIPAFIIALPVLKASNRVLGKIWPGDETSAFPRSALVGRVGVVTIGTATAERAAEVKVVGPDGSAHYVMTFATDDALPQGAEVELVEALSGGRGFRGVANKNPHLSPRHYT